MFSLQKFLGKDPQFYDLLENSARAAVSSAQALKAVIADPSLANLHPLRQARAESKRLTEELGELAVKTFITIVDREDLEALSSAIYKIPKPIEKFAERYMMVREVFKSPRQFQQIDFIEESAQTVLKMVKSLRRGINSEFVQRLNQRLQHVEAEADTLEVELLKELYRSCSNPMEAVAVSDLFDLLEKAIDRCRDAGNVVLHICHKNS